MIYTLCGSTRFPDAFALANMHLSLQGHIVIGLGMMGHADEPRGARWLTSDGDETTPAKQALDALHRRKIDLSDGIYVVNVGGYVGSSTRKEIAYAEETGKRVVWMFPGRDPMSTPTGYRVSFTRIGRKHDVPPLDVLGITDRYDDQLLDAVYAYARPRLSSKEVEVYVNTDEMRGVIIVGSGRPAGEFTITAVTR